MNLLLINFEMNPESPVLAWQYNLYKRIAPRFENVEVLTYKFQKLDPKTEEKVHTFHGLSPFRFFKPLHWLYLNFKIYKLCREKKIDVCFVHMNHPSSWLLWPVWALRRIPVLLWYAHGSTEWHLYPTLFSCSRIISSSKDGFRLKTKKLKIIGQGVDSDLFKIPTKLSNNDIVYVGRISERKKIKEIIQSFILLKAKLKSRPLRLRLVGPVMNEEDELYQKECEQMATADIEFLGQLPPNELPALYQSACLHLNLSQTGSLDKTVLEALSCGCPVLSSNLAFKNFFQNSFPEQYIASLVPEEIATRMAKIINTPPKAEDLRALIVGVNDLNSFEGKIVEELNALYKEGRKGL